MSVLCLHAQRNTLSGIIKDAGTQETLPAAGVALLTERDSAQVYGVLTDTAGRFTIEKIRNGSYLLRVSYVGYQSLYRKVTLGKSERNLDMGVLNLQENVRLMEEATVTAKVAQMEMSADTFIYNSDAFRLPEGSALEELVKKLPGAEVSEDGSIKINGKSINKILVEGKEFFEDDPKMAMKNLPSKIIKKLKAYDKKSDYSRITGIDDGEEETVLDLSIRKGMKNGWNINADGAYGTEERYSAQLNVNRFLDNSQMSLIGSANNVNGQGFPGGGGRFWGGGGGIVSTEMGGINFAWQNGKPDFTAGLLKLRGNVFFNHRNSESLSRTNSETFLDNVNSTFSNSFSSSQNGSSNVFARFNLEWMPDSMTNIMFRPRFSHSESDSRSSSANVTFNSNPYEYFTNPLEEYNLPENEEIRNQIAVNDNKRQSKSQGNSNDFSASLQWNRRLMKPGRNVNLDVDGGVSQNDNTSFSRNEITYFQRHTSDFTNQYNPTPSKSHNVQGRLSYSEPILGALNLQVSYRYQYRYSDSDRSMYSIDSLLTKYPGKYTQEQLYLGYIPGLDTLDYIRNIENSQYATYKEHNHDISLMFRYNVGENRLNFGVSLQPQTTYMDYAKNLLDTTVTRNTFNWAPRIDYRWKFSDTGQFRMRFNGNMSQPSMVSLLEVIDSSDPLNISTGNSGLKSSWSNRFVVSYNDYHAPKQMGWSVDWNFNQSKNSISSATIYNRESGARYTRPMNINGNWNTGGYLNFNTALGAKKMFNLNIGSNVSYNHQVGFLSSNSDGTSWGDIYRPDGSVDMDKIFMNTKLNKSVTKHTNWGEYLRLGYRNDILEVGLNGGLNYSHAKNRVQESANMDTWNFNYGGNVIVNAPWGMSLSTDISQQSRRGYDDKNMNTNELIWNAQLSQSFLKERRGTISVQWYDILRERSNISRNISAIMRSDSWNNAIHSYVMVHFIYRLNLMGGRSGGGGQGDRRGGGPGGPMRGW